MIRFLLRFNGMLLLASSLYSPTQASDEGNKNEASEEEYVDIQFGDEGDVVPFMPGIENTSLTSSTIKMPSSPTALSSAKSADNTHKSEKAEEDNDYMNISLSDDGTVLSFMPYTDTPSIPNVSSKSPAPELTDKEGWMDIDFDVNGSIAPFMPIAFTSDSLTSHDVKGSVEKPGVLGKKVGDAYEVIPHGGGHVIGYLSEDVGDSTKPSLKTRKALLPGLKLFPSTSLPSMAKAGYGYLGVKSGIVRSNALSARNVINSILNTPSLDKDVSTGATTPPAAIRHEAKSRFATETLLPIAFSQPLNGKTFKDAMARLSENGPVRFDVRQNSVWIAPYANFNKNHDSKKSIKGYVNTGGALLGFERRAMADRLKFGVFAGYSQSTYKQKLAHIKGDVENHTFGVYHSFEFLNNIRYRVKAIHTGSLVHNKRSDDLASYVAKSEYRINTDSLDFDLSYNRQLDNGWSLRTLIGHAYSHSDERGRVEKGAPAGENLRVARSKGHLSEVYTGVQLERNWAEGDNKYNIGASYEFGAEYSKRNGSGKISVATSPSGAVKLANNKKAKTHYVGLRASLSNEPSRVKYSFDYQTALSKKNQNHTVMFRVDFKF